MGLHPSCAAFHLLLDPDMPMCMDACKVQGYAGCSNASERQASDVAHKRRATETCSWQHITLASTAEDF